MSEETQTSLRLTRRGLSAAGKSLGLAPGDQLVAINGKTFTGDAQSLNARFKKAGENGLALSFRRGERDFTVLAQHPNLGMWELAPLEKPYAGDRVDPDLLDNWQVLSRADGCYDLVRMRPSVLATVLPSLWLMQMRLWGAMAAITGLILVLTAVWWPMGILANLMGGYYLRIGGNDMIRHDRALRGLFPKSVIAARSEVQAHRLYQEANPGAHFLFGPEKEAEREAEDEVSVDA